MFALVKGFFLNNLLLLFAENVGDSAVDDVKKAGSQSPRSPVETSVANSPSEQQEESSGEQQQQQRSAGNSSSSAQNVAEESGAPCEMRRTPPQNKGKFNIYNFIYYRYRALSILF